MLVISQAAFGIGTPGISVGFIFLDCKRADTKFYVGFHGFDTIRNSPDYFINIIPAPIMYSGKATAGGGEVGTIGVYFRRGIRVKVIVEVNGIYIVIPHHFHNNTHNVLPHFGQAGFKVFFTGVGNRGYIE